MSPNSSPSTASRFMYRPMSCSSVIPIPPCICTPSRTASFATSAGLGLGDRDEQLGPLIAGIEQLRGLERRGAGDLDLAIEMRGAVLQRLELADRFAELLALLKIIEGHRGSAGGDSDQLGRRAGAAGIQRPGQRLPAAVDLADYRVSVELDIVEVSRAAFDAVGQC